MHYNQRRKFARQRDFLRKKANKTGSKYLKQAFQQIKNVVNYKLRSLRSEYYAHGVDLAFLQTGISGVGYF